MVEKSTFNPVKETMVLTKNDVKASLSALGIQNGMVILLQADLNKLACLAGGAQMLIEAIIELIGYEGTLIIPSFTLNLCDPANQTIATSRNRWKEIRKSMIPFRKKLTIPDDELAAQFIRNEGVVRSYHPLYSFSAWGKYAKMICDKHPLHFGLNEDSPLGKIDELQGYCVMLGMSFDECLMLKLAQYRKKDHPIKVISSPIESNRVSVWKAMLDYELQPRKFSKVKEMMDDRSIIRYDYLGNTQCMLFSAKQIASYAYSYYDK